LQPATDASRHSTAAIPQIRACILGEPSADPRPGPGRAIFTGRRSPVKSATSPRARASGRRGQGAVRRGM
jgi:hypothetical protein